MYPKTKEIVYFYDSYAPSLEDGILYHLLRQIPSSRS